MKNQWILSSVVAGVLVFAPLAKADQASEPAAKTQKAEKVSGKKQKKMSCDCGDCEKNKCAEKKCEHCNHEEGHDHAKEQKKN